jgi:hypothetical protein
MGDARADLVRFFSGCMQIRSLATDADREIQPDIVSFLQSRGVTKLGIHCPGIISYADWRNNAYIHLYHEVHHLVGRGSPEQQAARPPSLPNTIPAGVVSLNGPLLASHLFPPRLLPVDAEVCSASCRFKGALTTAEAVTRNNIALCGHIWQSVT